MRISDWSSDVCSSDLSVVCRAGAPPLHRRASCRLAQAQGDRVVTRRRYAVATLLTGALFSVLFAVVAFRAPRPRRSEEHTSELQSLMRISYAVFCLKKKKRPSGTRRAVCSTRAHTSSPLRQLGDITISRN